MKRNPYRAENIVLFIFFMLLLCGMVWAAASSISTSITVSGLGSASTSLSMSYSGVAPDAMTKGYAQIAVDDTAEALEVGDISTIAGILISCIDDSDSNSTLVLEVDPNYASSFEAHIIISEGMSAYFQPHGAIWVRNQSTDVNDLDYEYVIFGTR